MPSQTTQPDNVLPAHRALSFLKSVEQGEVIFRCYRSILLNSMTWYIASHRNCTIVTFSSLSSTFEARSDVSEGDGNWHRLHVKQKSASFGQTSLHFRNASCSWMGGSWFFHGFSKPRSGSKYGEVRVKSICWKKRHVAHLFWTGFTPAAFFTIFLSMKIEQVESSEKKATQTAKCADWDMSQNQQPANWFASKWTPKRASVQQDP